MPGSRTSAAGQAGPDGRHLMSQQSEDRTGPTRRPVCPRARDPRERRAAHEARREVHSTQRNAAHEGRRPSSPERRLAATERLLSHAESAPAEAGRHTHPREPRSAEPHRAGSSAQRRTALRERPSSRGQPCPSPARRPGSAAQRCVAQTRGPSSPPERQRDSSRRPPSARRPTTGRGKRPCKCRAAEHPCGQPTRFRASSGAPLGTWSTRLAVLAVRCVSPQHSYASSPVDQAKEDTPFVENC